MKKQDLLKHALEDWVRLGPDGIRLGWHAELMGYKIKQGHSLEGFNNTIEYALQALAAPDIAADEIDPRLLLGIAKGYLKAVLFFGDEGKPTGKGDIAEMIKEHDNKLYHACCDLLGINPLHPSELQP